MTSSIVSVSGTYWSGSSVLVDIFSEHPSSRIVPDEFSIFSYGQLFYELNNAFSGSLNSIVLNSLYQSLICFGKSEPYLIFKCARFICHSLNVYPPFLFRRHTGMYSLLGDEFKSSTRDLSSCLRSCIFSHEIPSPALISDLVTRIIASVDRTYNTERSSHLVFDQFVSPFYLQDTLQFLPSIKVVCVDRDFKDQYASFRRVIDRMLRVNSRLFTSPSLDSYPNTFNSSSFIDYFVDLRRRVDTLKFYQHTNLSSNILWVDFEDLMTNTSSTVKSIFDFVEIDFDLWKPFTKFKPNNRKLGQWKKSRYISEIEEISHLLCY